MTSKHGWLFDLLHYGPVCSRVTDRHGLTVNILENGRDIIVDALTALNERESLTVSEICKRVNDHTSCPAFFIGEIECCFILTFYPDFFKMEKTPDSRFILHMMATRPKPRFKKYSDKVPIETILKMVTESGGTIGSNTVGYSRPFPLLYIQSNTCLKRSNRISLSGNFPSSKG